MTLSTAHDNIQPQPLPALLRRLARVGWGVMALSSLWTFSWTLIFTWQLSFSPSARLTAAYSQLNISAAFFFWANALPLIIQFAAHFIVAVLLFVRLPNDRMALFVAAYLMAFGTANSYPNLTEFVQVWSSGNYYYLVPFVAISLLAWPLMTLFFAIYPDGQFVPRNMRLIALYGFVFSLAWSAAPQAFAAPSDWLAIAIGISIVLVYGGSLFAQIYRYRFHSTRLQRQQTKWMVYSVLVIVIFSTLKQLVTQTALSDPASTAADTIRLELIFSVAGVVLAFVPIAVGVAILRYRLYDIDVLIHRTLVYSAVSGLLALAYFGSVIVLQSIFSAFGGGQSELATVFSTLIIAVLFFPLRSRVQAFVDRRFYRRKYDAAKTLAVFAQTARDEVELDRLSSRLVQVVDETVQPEVVRLWLTRSTGASQK